MEKKNILLLVPSLGIGGQERIAVNTASCLTTSYNVYILTFQRLGKEYDTTCQRFNLNLPATSNSVFRIFQQFRRALKIRAFCKEYHIDCLISFGKTANLSSVLSTVFTRRKTIVTIHGFAEVYRGIINSFIFSHANRVVCISNDMQFRLLQLYPHMNNCSVINNGYDISEHVYNKKQNRKNDYFLNIVGMGRLEYVKGFDRLIKAFAKFHSRIPRSHLTIIGEGSERPNLENLVYKNQLEDCITFCGYLQDPYTELMKNEVFVLSSRNEGFPNAIIEALACRLCVISVDCLTGPREILLGKYTPEPVRGIKIGEYGILVENAKNENSIVSLLSDACLYLINNPDLRKLYCENGPQRCLDFSLSRYATQFDVLIKSLIEQ